MSLSYRTLRRMDMLIAAGYTLEDRGTGERLFYPPSAIPDDPGLRSIDAAVAHLLMSRRTEFDRISAITENGGGYVPQLSTRMFVPIRPRRRPPRRPPSQPCTTAGQRVAARPRERRGSRRLSRAGPSGDDPSEPEPPLGGGTTWARLVARVRGWWSR